MVFVTLYDYLGLPLGPVTLITLATTLLNCPYCAMSHDSEFKRDVQTKIRPAAHHCQTEYMKWQKSLSPRVHCVIWTRPFLSYWFTFITTKTHTAMEIQV